MRSSVATTPGARQRREGSVFAHTGLIALLFVLATAWFGVVDGAIDPEDPAYAGWDLHQYREMAAAAPGLAAVPAPFGFRLLGPWIAGTSPLSQESSFRALTLGAAVVLVVAFFLLLVQVRIAPPIAAVGAGLLALNKYVVGFPVWDYFQVNDLLALATLVALYGSVLARRWVMFAILLVVGVLARETSLIIVPVALLLGVERRDGRPQRLALALATVPGLVAFGALRLLVPYDEGVGLVGTFASNVTKLASPGRWYALLLNTFMPVTALLVVYADRLVARLERSPHLALWLGLVFAGALMGSNDERLMAPAALVVYMIAAELVNEVADGRWVRLTLLMLAAAASGFDHMIGRWRLPGLAASYTVGLAAAAVVLACFAHARWRDKGRHVPMNETAER